mmetsp:Transcript_30896/g.65595  ORF Transcript_30896/g.65595 Transcript_30896/m.65595 type:complete len:125 (+) Transcript_30896:96-470(+)
MRVATFFGCVLAAQGVSVHGKVAVPTSVEDSAEKDLQGLGEETQRAVTPHHTVQAEAEGDSIEQGLEVADEDEKGTALVQDEPQVEAGGDSIEQGLEVADEDEKGTALVQDEPQNPFLHRTASA